MSTRMSGAAAGSTARTIALARPDATMAFP
jgi:hypothetical protein